MLCAKIVFFILFYGQVELKKMYVYVGEDSEGEAYKIYVIPDINLAHTYIHPKDFNCVKENGCELEDEIHLGSYHGHQVEYRYANVQINLLLFPFSNPCRARYIVDREKIRMSILGISSNSTFYQYLSFQNYLKMMPMSFYFDWENVFYFQNEELGESKLALDTPMNVNVSFFKQSKRLSEVYKFCLANQPPFQESEFHYFLIKKDLFKNWSSFMKETKRASDKNTDGTLKFNFTFELFNEEYPTLGKMELTIDDLVDDRGSLNIISFESDYDDGRGCEIYLGGSAMRKFKYKFFYSENNDGNFFLNFTFAGLANVFEQNKLEKSILWLQMIFFVIVFSFIVFLSYEYVLKRSQDNGLRDDDLSIPGEENEEKGFNDIKFKITKEEITLLEKGM